MEILLGAIMGAAVSLLTALSAHWVVTRDSRRKDKIIASKVKLDEEEQKSKIQQEQTTQDVNLILKSRTHLNKEYMILFDVFRKQIVEMADEKDKAHQERQDCANERDKLRRDMESMMLSYASQARKIQELQDEMTLLKNRLQGDE